MEFPKIGIIFNKKALAAVGLGVGAIIVCRFWLPSHRRRKRVERLQQMVEDKRRTTNDDADSLRRRLASAPADIQAKRDKIVNLDFETLRRKF